jgi:hypothetical protein
MIRRGLEQDVMILFAGCQHWRLVEVEAMKRLFGTHNPEEMDKAFCPKCNEKRYVAGWCYSHPVGEEEKNMK